MNNILFIHFVLILWFVSTNDCKVETKLFWKINFIKTITKRLVGFLIKECEQQHDDDYLVLNVKTASSNEHKKFTNTYYKH